MGDSVYEPRIGEVFTIIAGTPSPGMSNVMVPPPRSFTSSMAGKHRHRARKGV